MADGGTPVSMSVGGATISVNVSDLLSYGGAVEKMYLASVPQPFSLLGDVPALAQTAFAGLGGDAQAGTFEGGVYAIEQQTIAQSEFMAFMKDLMRGLQVIASAASVVADSYAGTDAESAATLNDINYAFADPTAKRPAGLPNIPHVLDGTTFGEQDMAQAASIPDAITAPDSAAVSSVGGVLVFADGSKRVVTSSSTLNYNGRDDQTTTTATTTQYYGTNGKAIAPADVESETTTPSGQVVESVESSGGTTTTIAAGTDGGQMITVTTVNPAAPNDPSKAHTRTYEVKPSQEAPADGSGAAPGPVQTAEKKYHTEGSPGYVGKHGPGY